MLAHLAAIVCKKESTWSTPRAEKESEITEEEWGNLDIQEFHKQTAIIAVV
jgi:hypothetical protein